MVLCCLETSSSSKGRFPSLLHARVFFPKRTPESKSFLPRKRAARYIWEENGRRTFQKKKGIAFAAADAPRLPQVMPCSQSSLRAFSVLLFAPLLARAVSASTSTADSAEMAYVNANDNAIFATTDPDRLYLRDNFRRDVLLRFRAQDLTGVVPAGSNWINATLTMRVQAATGSLLDRPVFSYFCSDDSWLASTVNFGSAPTAEAQIGSWGVGPNVVNADWVYPINVSAVKTELDTGGDGAFSLRIVGNSNGATGRAFFYRTSVKPRLTITYSPPATTGIIPASSTGGVVTTGATTGSTTGSTTGALTSTTAGSVSASGSSAFFAGLALLWWIVIAAACCCCVVGLVAVIVFRSRKKDVDAEWLFDTRLAAVPTTDRAHQVFGELAAHDLYTVSASDDALDEFSELMADFSVAPSADTHTAIVDAMCAVSDPSDYDDISVALVALFAARHGGVSALLEHLIEVEAAVAENEDAGAAFRSNSMATKAFGTFSKLVAIPWLSANVVPVVQEIVDVVDELDPEELPSLKNAMDGNEDAAKSIQGFCESILGALTQNELPGLFRDCLHSLSEAISDHLGEDDRGMLLSSFVFIRFLCPSIIAPHVMGLERPSLQVTRVLIDISKVLQALTSKAEIGKKDKNLQVMEDFILRERPRVQEFIMETASSPGADSELCVPAKELRKVARNAHAVLHGYVSRGSDSYSLEQELQERLAACLKNLGDVPEKKTKSE
jgi:GTPase-activator protein for Ras-like GTPase